MQDRSECPVKTRVDLSFPPLNVRGGSPALGARAFTSAGTRPRSRGAS